MQKFKLPIWVQLLLPVILTGLTACSPTIPLPKAFAVNSAAELHERMRTHFSKVQSLSADMDFRAFADGQRFKSTAVLLVNHPGSMRLDIFGPHGGVLQAFAMNPQEVVLLDMKESRAFRGPPRAATLDALLPVAPLSLPPEFWTEMLLGRLPEEFLRDL